MSQALARCWYGACKAPWRWLLPLLGPLSLLFRLLAGLRRAGYRLGLLRTIRLPVPVVVVGNITAGGAGKTPLTLALAGWLREAGYRPGIISRGYGGCAREPMAVPPDGDTRLFGDEPVLMARRTGCPVWIGRHRGEAGRLLLAHHPQVDVLLADDGLQHLALARDVELAVVDGDRGFGNGRLLPAGPLREPVSRLASLDAVVINGGAGMALNLPVPHFSMTLAGAEFVNLVRPDLRVSATHFRGRVQALAGIGHPDRFFRRLTELSLDIQAHAFPDHHPYQASDLPAGTLLMTEKDAVKCAAFAHDDCWFLAVDAEVEGGLKTLLLNHLKDRNGSQAA